MIVLFYSLEFDFSKQLYLLHFPQVEVYEIDSHTILYFYWHFDTTFSNFILDNLENIEDSSALLDFSNDVVFLYYHLFSYDFI